MNPDDNQIAAYLQRSRTALDRAAADPKLLAVIRAIADALLVSFQNHGKLLIAGNGGSAADAQHMAAEFVCRLNMDRLPLPAIAITTDSSVLSAAGNDYGFEHVFERQVRGLGKAGDVFLAISTSGRSPNIIRALKAAREMGLKTVGFTGDGQREMTTFCDLCLAAPASETSIIQQIHSVAAHAICGVVEYELFGKAKPR